MCKNKILCNVCRTHGAPVTPEVDGWTVVLVVDWTVVLVVDSGAWMAWQLEKITITITQIQLQKKRIVSLALQLEFM